MSAETITPVRSAKPSLPAGLVIPHPRPFICTLTITPDAIGEVVAHVTNVEYVRWLDRAAELHADHLGYTRRVMLDQGWMWFVARHEVDYEAECWEGDELILATWVRDMGRIKSWRDTVAWRPADGRVVMRAATLWVFVDLETRRPARVPTEMADQFDPLAAIGGTPCASA